MSGKKWYVAGYDSNRQFFGTTLPASSVSEEEIRNLLQRLSSKFLSALEIVESTKGTLENRGLLEVTVDSHSIRPMLTVGTNPYFTATLYDAGERPELEEVQHTAPKVADWSSL